MIPPVQNGNPGIIPPWLRQPHPDLPVIQRQVGEPRPWEPDDPTQNPPHERPTR